jgi:Xaa-Pro aminopeptidase
LFESNTKPPASASRTGEIAENNDDSSNIMTPLFPKSEFEDRHKRILIAMSTNGLDSIVLFSPVNVFWASGYLGSPSHRKTPEFIHLFSYPWILIPNSDDPAIVGNSGAMKSYERETTIQRIFTHHPTANRAPTLVKALEELHLVDQTKIIGFDLGDYESISVPQFQYLQEKLKGVRRIQDNTMILQSLRMIKSPRERMSSHRSEHPE